MEDHKKPMNVDGLRKTLRKFNLKVTPTRLAVHEAMLHLGHASADMITEYLEANEGPKVTVASVYNILSQFSLLGIYQHRMSANNKMYFDVNTFKHMHLYDIVNNEYIDVVDDTLVRQVEDAISHKRFKGYKVEDVDIQIVCRPSGRRKKALARE